MVESDTSMSGLVFVDYPDLPRPMTDGLCWTEHVFRCLTKQDPAEVLRSVVAPKAKPMMAPRLGRIKSEIVGNRSVVLNTDYSGMELTITVTFPQQWTFMDHEAAPYISWADDLQADMAVWCLTLQTDWNHAEDQEAFPPFAGPRDILAALMESDAFTIMEDQSEIVDLLRLGWVRPRLNLPTATEILIPAKYDGDRVLSNRHLLSSDNRIHGIREVESLDPLQAILTPIPRQGAGTVSPDHLLALETRLLAALRCSDD